VSTDETIFPPTLACLTNCTELKSDRKRFLTSLSSEKRDALIPSSVTQTNDSGAAAREAKLREQGIQQLKALRAYGIPAHELVDIGANLQERNSRAGICRLLERSAASGTTRVVLTGCSIKGSRKGLDTCRWWATQQRSACPSATGVESADIATTMPSGGVRLYGTVGVHPHDAKTICVSTTTGNVANVSVREDCLETLRTLASDPFCVSLGECGLDYDRMLSSREMQLAAFEAQVALAASLAKPLFVHLRELDADRGAPIGAYADAAEILSKYPAIPPDNVCIHCFTGDSADLSQLMTRGYMLGLTGFAGMKKRAAANGTLAALGAGKDTFYFSNKGCAFFSLFSRIS
jgi:Tat protein secretion system quality control protein TatD with DNase activity